MAIANRDITTSFEKKHVPPVAVNSNFKGTMFDNNNAPLTALIANASGRPWTIERFFNQRLGQHNEAKAPDSHLSPELQGYDLINNLEIRVESELTTSTDSATGQSVVQGSGLVHGFMTPNVHDVFITAVAHNRPGILRITSVGRKTYRNNSMHYIDYVLDGYVDKNMDIMQTLEDKVIDTYFFSRERVMEGLNPHLTTKQFNSLLNLRANYEKLGEYFLRTFYHRGCGTLVIPGQPKLQLFDPFLFDFIHRTFPLMELNSAINLTPLPPAGDQFVEQSQFWSAFFNRDLKELEYGNKIMGIAPTAAFDENTFIRGLFHARMDGIIYPKSPDTSVYSYGDIGPACTRMDLIEPTFNYNGVHLTHAEKLYPAKNGVHLSYPMVLGDDFYVLSEAFYNQTADMTVLEWLVRDFMGDKSLNLDQLEHLIELYPRMERLEQFYYGPILMTLIRNADRRMY